MESNVVTDGLVRPENAITTGKAEEAAVRTEDAIPATIGIEDRREVNAVIAKRTTEENIMFVRLLTAPEGITAVCQHYRSTRFVTSTIEAR